MPNSKSAKKRLRQSKDRRTAARSVKSAVRTQVKKVLVAVEQGDVETAEKEYVGAASKLDHAGSRGVIHKNTAGRGKARLQRRIKAAKSGA